MPKMTKKNIQCSHVGLGRTTVLWAKGRRGFDGITGSGRTIALRARGRRGSSASRARERRGGAQRHGLGEVDVVAGLGTASQAQGRGLRGQQHHRLRSGKMVARKGVDRGRERRCKGSGEDSTMAWRLRRGRRWHGL
jgi:hypothetical protein